MDTNYSRFRTKSVRNKERDRENGYILIWAKKLKAYKYKGNECSICNNRDFRVFSFHHSEKKEHVIQMLFGSKARWEKIRGELDKCILVCENCHRELHDSKIRNERQKLNKQILLSFVKQFECSECGYKKIDTALHFHHRNKNEKENGIAKFSYRHAWKTVADITEDVILELSKCSVLCANCHRIEHFDMQRFKKNESKIIEKSNSMKEKIIVDPKLILDLNSNGMSNIEIHRTTGYSVARIYEILRCNGRNQIGKIRMKAGPE